MRVDFSEPEYRNCYHCRDSGILNTQESEPNNVIGSSITSVPVSSGPFQALGHASAAIGSTSTSSPVQSSSSFSFGSAPAATTSVGVSSTSTPTPISFLPFGYVPPPPPSSSLSGPAQNVPWSISAYSTAGRGVEWAWARPDVAVYPASSSSSSTSTVVFGTTPVSVSSLFGPSQDFPKTTFACCSSTPAPTRCECSFAKPFFGSSPASSSSNLFGPNPSTTTASVFGTSATSGSSLFGPAQHPLSYDSIGGSAFAGVKTSSPQPLGFNGATTLLPSSHEGQNISSFKPYVDKSHDELRWEYYKKEAKGGSFPAAHASPIGSKPNAVFSPSTVSTSLFASPSVPDHHQRTNFSTTLGNFTGPAFGFFPAAAGGATTFSSTGFGQPNAPFPGFDSQFPSAFSSFSTTYPAVSSSVQRPHETGAVSSPAFGCTACGATSSSSASDHFTFNGATTPPGLFFPTTSSGPMMFGTTLAAQGTTPALQTYPVQGFILLPFTAMNLHFCSNFFTFCIKLCLPNCRTKSLS
ncbi:hypothetical protein AT1G63530 [Arabidopsis thaliana]|uniref:Uncharacterized protein n=1 Tax=Arabidopsis thaliana TaxID=3702 RepID=A0A1P8AR38_ARATH|nr:uncharacterized protein AT1G63530 [Arabidopsis thaliana]NP_001321451.1 uncharacterized protein AT1G63530 [Arabidopsis thaliana]ANM59056.1 hypothetical protein AT1G63530 [Arabidopsis thaliana]ANM59057.1 hypothetical protein AT1G63530 [Arabidopsis thaliana]|eukprot:NP_001321450.1 hypothetical protein AT1G63530 [Arabidopsis thaliana]